MATTSKNFVGVLASAGSGLGAYGVALALSAAQATAMKTASLGAVLDRLTVDLATAGYAKNGALILPLSISTPVTIDLTALGSLGVTAGDVSFATWNVLRFKSLAGGDVAISPGASNPLRTPLAGTSPTFTVYSGGEGYWHTPAGLVVDSTHKTLKFDPGLTTATIALCIGGS